MRYFNKLELNKKQIKILMKELVNIYEYKKIEDIKKINKGIYQIFIWELFLYEYLKEFDPFIFIDMNQFQKRFGKNKDMKIINYYLQLINYLKYYLKFKYHFHSLYITNIR